MNATSPKPILFLLLLLLAADSFSRPWSRWMENFHRDAAGRFDRIKGLRSEIFENRVDHFDFNSDKTYRQRYWYSENYWDRDSGPMILYVHGEWVGFELSDNSITMQLVQQLHAKVFFLEHRFYGSSQPCEDWSLQNLRLLTHEQALADIAYFIEEQNRGLKTAQKKWLLIGGSYAGALVAWFRVKYPHLAHAVYSSSGVVASITDYHKYTDQVYLDFSRDPDCLKALTELNAYATNIVLKGSAEQKAKLKAAMKAGALEDLDFLAYFTDMPVAAIQAGVRKEICPKIKAISKMKDPDTRLDAYATFGIMYGINPSDYTLNEVKRTQINHLLSTRQWLYQECTGLGFFRTGSASNPLRPKILGLDYWKGVCTRVFDAALFPSEDYTNAIMGDTRVAKLMSHAVFINGGDDPWKWAGVRDESLSGENLFVKVLNCEDCTHCLDLGSDTSDDPEVLTQTREKIKAVIVKWMTN